MANFYNNVESIWEGLVKKNRCYKLDSNAEFTVEAGAADKVGKSKAKKKEGVHFVGSSKYTELHEIHYYSFIMSLLKCCN